MKSDKAVSETPSVENGPGEPRRGFLAKISAVAIGAVIILAPIGAGVAMLFDPVRRRGSSGKREFIRLTSLNDLPADGKPRRFPVVADRNDAWSRLPREPIGAVYLRRSEGDQLQAFNATCPHAGCSVSYREQANDFLCPCHNSAFRVSGEAIQPSPSPRDLDTLEVKVEGTDVLVKFENFYTGRTEKKAKS